MEYFVVLDFEATCFPNPWDQNWFAEIVDFAAVLLNLRTGSIEHEYRAIVRPTHFPQLSRGCMDKLGISQNHFNGARTLSMVLADFSNWLANIMRSCDVVMPETDVLYQGRRYMVLCTWSHSDLGTFLFNEANMKRIPVPEALKYWTDAQKVFRSMYPDVSTKLSDAAYALQIEPVQPAHTALADARTTAKIAYKLHVKGGNFFQLSKTRDR